ncbi:MAG: hypothetical protein M3499_00100 [Actinomycetota bacterium]|nr:hypothetical protein [Actinomycetota bacterium]
MSRLTHVNGPPGIGKSTLARRYVNGHPGVLNCDIDVLKTLVGDNSPSVSARRAHVKSHAVIFWRRHRLARASELGHDLHVEQTLFDSGRVAMQPAGRSSIFAATRQIFTRVAERRNNWAT